VIDNKSLVEVTAPVKIAQQDIKKAEDNSNNALAAELGFELFKQYSWLSSALIGGIVVMVQLKIIELGMFVYWPIGLLVLAIFNSMIAKDHIVDAIINNRSIQQIRKSLVVMRFVSMFSLGTAVGLFTGNFY
jgi:hypothetical protein